MAAGKLGLSIVQACYPRSTVLLCVAMEREPLWSGDAELRSVDTPQVDPLDPNPTQP